MTPTARTTGAALTADRLGEAWPEVSTRLRRMLGSRGVDSSLIDDIVQEVAVRALDKRVPFTDPADLYRWAATAARRLHIDHLRCDGRTTYDDALLAVADGTDVAHAAERRVALGHVLRAMAVMRPGERDAILDSLEDREARTSQALVRRHRARASLKKAVGGMLAWLTLARLRLRTVAPALRDVSAATALAPALALGTAALLPGGADPAPARPVAVAPLERSPERAPARVAPRRQAPAAPTAVRPARAAARVARPAAPAPAEPAGPQLRNEKEAGPVTYGEYDPPSDSRLLCVSRGSDPEPLWCTPDLAPGPRP